MPCIALRSEIESILRRWQSGELTHVEVFDWANNRFCTSQWDPEDEIVNEVLSELDTLNINLTTADDISHLLGLLKIPSGELEIARSHQVAYSKTIDLQSRRAALVNDPFYAPFCK
jgi:hypothetical protein